MIIDFNLTQSKATPAWFKRFSVRYKPLQGSACAQEALFKELIKYIEDTISGHSPLGFTMISTQGWMDKIKQDDVDGAAVIFDDVTAMIKELSRKKQIDLIADIAERKLLKSDDLDTIVKEQGKGTLLTESALRKLIPDEAVKALLTDENAYKLFEDITQEDMTLMVPKKYNSAFLIPTGTMGNALDRLTQRYPGLKINYCDDMVNVQEPFALLVFDKGAPDVNEIGHLEQQVSTTLLEEDPANDTTNKPNIPPYSLVIFHPEQIAVLTGI